MYNRYLDRFEGKVGDKVQGRYFGGTFTGTISATRWHTINRNWLDVHVVIDEPLVYLRGSSVREAGDTIIISTLELADRTHELEGAN